MGSITRNFANSITATSNLDSGINFKNLLINGDMTIYQPATTKTSITADENQSGADRYHLRVNARTSWVGTLANEPTFVPANQGFKKALYVQTTTAETSVGAAEIIRIGQKIEANMLPHLKYGTDQAKPITFSFWVRSSETGTYAAELWHRDHPSDTGYNSQSFSISSADTWEKKTVTFQGDTVNGFNYDTGIGLQCHIWLGAGTNWTSGGSTTGGVWSTDETKRAYGTTNNFINTLNANFYTTGWQLEIGETATDFEFIPNDVNLARCQRYYYRWNSEDPYGPLCQGMQIGASNCMTQGYHPVPMRTAPSISISGTWSCEHGTTSTTYALSGTRRNKYAWSNEQSISATDGSAAIVYGSNDSNAYFEAEAEL